MKMAGEEWSPDIPLSEMCKIVEGKAPIKKKENEEKEIVGGNKCLNKEATDFNFSDEELFSRHVIEAKYAKKGASEGKGYLLLFPPEHHSDAESKLRTWPSSWEVWEYCKLKLNMLKKVRRRVKATCYYFLPSIIAMLNP